MEVSRKIGVKNLPAVQRDGHWALRLASKTPEQTIKELEAKLEIMFGDKYERVGKATSDEYGWDFIHTGYEIKSNDLVSLQEAYRLAFKVNEPYPKETLEKQLEVLYRVQAKVGEGNAKEKARLIAMLMLDIPADLANYTIKYNAKYNKFWSTYEELYKPIAFKVEARKNLLFSLENKLDSL